MSFAAQTPPRPPQRRRRERSGRGSFAWWLGLLAAASVFVPAGWSDDNLAHAVGAVGLFVALGVTIVHGNWLFSSEGRTEARIMTAGVLAGVLAILAVILDQIVQPLSGYQLSLSVLGTCWALAAIGVLRKKPGRASPPNVRPPGTAPRTWPWWLAAALAGLGLIASIGFAWRTEVDELTPTGPIITSTDPGQVQLSNPSNEPLRLQLDLPRGTRTITLPPGGSETIRTSKAPGAVARLKNLDVEGAPTLTVTIGSGGA